jgi:hypothetical protein
VVVTKRLLLVLPLLALLYGCAITQKVTPVDRPLLVREICVMRNADVRENFLTAYLQALEAKGFSPRVLEPGASVGSCPLSSQYTANWRWDLALYMAYAKITIYENGTEVGSAVYDSLGGSGNLAKFIDAETKLKELVDQLFPAPSFAAAGTAR